LIRFVVGTPRGDVGAVRCNVKGNIDVKAGAILERRALDEMQLKTGIVAQKTINGLVFLGGCAGCGNVVGFKLRRQMTSATSIRNQIAGLYVVTNQRHIMMRVVSRLYLITHQCVFRKPDRFRVDQVLIGDEAIIGLHHARFKLHKLESSG
jgi:hypothetical protein